jgi:predicted hotdog family 3-hydroxylacyl-ACP dehydratase
MRSQIHFPIADIVPQADSMSLLSRAVEGDDTSIVVEADITPDCLFHEGPGVGGWVGIEYMAQAIAAWAGWRARLRGEPPHIGFLLGTRRYECSRPYFRSGETLRIEATQLLWADSGLGQFECSIAVDGEQVANAALTVFEPPDAAAFLKGEKNNE